MIHPSYTELIDKINAGVEMGEEPIVQSRYSIVIAAAKRARQIVAGEEAMNSTSEGVTKPLSQAVAELDEGIIHVLSDEEFEAEQAQIYAEFEALSAANEAVLDISEDEEEAEAGADDASAEEDVEAETEEQAEEENAEEEVSEENE